MKRWALSEGRSTKFETDGTGADGFASVCCVVSVLTESPIETEGHRNAPRLEVETGVG